jgi:transcriptional regulator with XRE-family HTH domain
VAVNHALDPATRLRLAREAKGLSVRQIAESTKLSVRAIEALEGDRVSALPEGIYRRAIIRAVASEVGLDPEQILRDFSNAHPDDLPAPSGPSAVVVAAPPARHAFQGALAFLGAILPMLAGVAYFAWPATGAADVAPVSLARSTRAADVWRPEIVPAGGFTEAPPALPRPVVVTLTISSKCQLRIVADGREVLGRTVEQGESVPIELGDELLLLGDNAAAVQFSINGQAGRMLGEPGGVLSVRIGRDDYEDFLVRH